MVPNSRQPYPEEAIGIVDLWAFEAALLNGQLLAESQIFKNDISFIPK
jgi:hypothetical protein